MINSDFYVDPHLVNKMVKTIKDENEKVHKLMLKRITASVNLVYSVARAKRQSISYMPDSKKIIHGRMKGASKIVSDPGAAFGVPVRTGQLRASIKKEVIDNPGKITGKVSTDSPYAAAIEFGRSDHNMKKRPFMRPALYMNQKAIEAMLKQKV